MVPPSADRANAERATPDQVLTGLLEIAITVQTQTVQRVLMDGRPLSKLLQSAAPAP